jgi:hypothetical protein
MSKSNATRKDKFPVEKLSGWDSLIGEAKQRIQDLEFSLKVFERKKADGEPCPKAVPQSDTELIQRAIA